jgi:hypothetical protein
MHFRLFMYLNGVIFQAYCVNFEIKKNKLQHDSFQIIYVFQWYIFPKSLC